MPAIRTRHVFTATPTIAWEDIDCHTGSQPDTRSETGWAGSPISTRLPVALDDTPSANPSPYRFLLLS